VDNSGGVDMSDHEVNIKILMDLLVKKGVVKGKAERNAILAEMTEEVGALVLADNQSQALALTLDGLRSAAHYPEFVALIDDMVGAGVLNVDGAVSATILASPTSINFGVGGATAALTRTLTIKNLSSTADTFTITPVARGENPAPSLATNKIQLDAGAAQEITVELNQADLAAGAYQGVLRIQGTQGQVNCTVPYWYAVSNGVAGNIRIVSSAVTGVPGQILSSGILFQITEASGVPVSNLEPVVTVAAGDGTVRAVQNLDLISPALYRVNLRLGPAAGDNIFRITAGEVTRDVVIPASR